MHKVVFVVKGKRQVEFLAGQRENLLEAARKAGIMIDTPCNGNGTCGKCKVQIIKEMCIRDRSMEKVVALLKRLVEIYS